MTIIVEFYSNIKNLILLIYHRLKIIEEVNKSLKYNRKNKSINSALNNTRI